MIDVYAPDDLFPAGADHHLAEELTSALLRAEDVTTPSAAHMANTAAYIHRLDARAVHTAGTGNARTVRVQVLTPPGALNRPGQRSFVNRSKIRCLINVEKALECSIAESSAGSPRVFAN